MTIRRRTRERLAWPIALPYVRVGLVAIAAALTALILTIIGQPAGAASVSLVAALYLLPVNVLCLLLVRRLVHREGGTLRAMIGFDRARLGRDLGWGLLWIVVLYVPFAGAIIGTMFALFGGEAFASFERVFAPDAAAIPSFGTPLLLTIAVIAVLTFAPLNAPTEELVFRGYSQGGLWRRPVLSVLLPSIAFGLQHVAFAPTVPGMVVFAVAFFVWGVGSALIYRAQRRLMPLIIAHFIVNLATSAPALVVPFLER